MNIVKNARDHYEIPEQVNCKNCSSIFDQVELSDLHYDKGYDGPIEYGRPIIYWTCEICMCNNTLTHLPYWMVERIYKDLKEKGHE